MEPDPSIFNEDLYYELVRDSLLAGYPDRECQMIGLPSFGSEFAVFVTCKNASLSIVLRMAPIGPIDSDEGNRAVRDRGRLLERIKKVTREYSVPIPQATVDLLRLAWTSMLSAVTASRYSSVCPDCAAYHFAHGGRTGRIWSPMPSSLCGKLVATAEAMRELAWDAPAGTQGKVVAQATDLLGRIPNVADQRRNRLTCP